MGGPLAVSAAWQRLAPAASVTGVITISVASVLTALADVGKIVPVLESAVLIGILTWVFAMGWTWWGGAGR
jgi:hypothetical protein